MLQLWNQISFHSMVPTKTGNMPLPLPHAYTPPPIPSRAHSRTKISPHANIPKRRNHMWQMLLHHLMHHLKPFGDCTAVMSNLAGILSTDNAVWIRALWRSPAGSEARKQCLKQSFPSTYVLRREKEQKKALQSQNISSFYCWITF